MELEHYRKVVILVDMDCFYCQVEEKLNPLLAGKPIAVVQYNAWKGGGIIAVNYPARDKGVTRHMRGNEAKEKCPDINLVSVPTLREKADLTKYRDAGKRVAEVLQTYTNLLERASVDEAYMDVTAAVDDRISTNYSITQDRLKNTHVVGYDIRDFIDSFRHEHHLESNFRLCMGGIIAEEIRAAVFEKTGYKCSAGIAHNKTLAKLACGLHKPNQQTILPQDGVEELFATLPLRKIRSLGGKFGYNLGEDLGINHVGELKQFSEKDLVNRYDEKTGSWLYKIARGIDVEAVTVRLVSKSIGCCKKFPGRTALIHPENVQHWVNELSNELSERLNKDLEENNRKAKHMVVSFVQQVGRKDVSASRTHPLSSYDPEKIATEVLKVLDKHCLNSYGSYHVKYLGISAGKFDDCKKGYDISSYFKTCDKETSAPCAKPEYSLSYFFSEMEKNRKVEDAINTESQRNFQRNVACEENNDENFKGNGLDAIFSEDTVPLDEADMILTNNENDVDVCPESSSPRNEDKDGDTDSIIGEIVTNPDSDEDVDVGEKNISSYFSNYFNKDKSLNRNFDTSRYLENNSSVDSGTSSVENIDTNSESASENLQFQKISEDYQPQNNLCESESTKESINSNTTIDINPISSEKLERTAPQTNSNDFNAFTNFQNYSRPFDENAVDGTKERCKECGKSVPTSEMVSHIDYHFALQMVRDEAHLYNNPTEATTRNLSKKSNEVKQNKKRKRCDTASAKLTSFLENIVQPLKDTPTEICPQCTKKIPTEEYLSHLDYHLAKKLHSEMNPMIQKPCMENNSVGHNRKPSTSKKTKRILKQSKPKSVISFFNQNM